MTAAPTSHDEQTLPSPAPHAFMLAMANYAETGKSPRSLTEREQKLLLEDVVLVLMKPPGRPPVVVVAP